MNMACDDSECDPDARFAHAGQSYERVGRRLFLVWLPAVDAHSERRAFARCAGALELLGPLSPSARGDGAVLLAQCHLGVLARALEAQDDHRARYRANLLREARRVLVRHAVGRAGTRGQALADAAAA